MVDKILKNYKTPDSSLGYRDTAAFEAEICDEIEEKGISFSDFKKIIIFLESNTLDDSATGLEYLYEALNGILRAGGKAKDWEWVKEHLLKENDFFLETVISLYKEAHQEELLNILETAGLECYRHFDEYYVALCLKGTPRYEAYLDEHLNKDDIKQLKSDLLVSKGDKKAAFDIIKSECVLEAAELLEGEEKAEYLFNQVLNGREVVIGEKRIWWEKLCEGIKDREKLNHYLDELMTSPYHCEMVNWKLYEFGRYEELKARIDTGWIYDNLWGKLDDNCVSKYSAIKGYKKLKELYPEWCAKIMIHYAVFMVENSPSRKHYAISAKTLIAAGKLGGMDMAQNAAKELVKRNPCKRAMKEELEKAGLV